MLWWCVVLGRHGSASGDPPDTISRLEAVPSITSLVDTPMPEQEDYPKGEDQQDPEHGRDFRLAYPTKVTLLDARQVLGALK